ncbi:helix-turn-helix domain-containing protein [Diaphorobacter caeni]|uniref:helix-turn-helix domain-containing protein n=1 Tax=Diaphorobacter caeni TaxID=2784387 RepID=UPI00188DFF45|nr:helix-turn-helix domain-containing protein [Diaphorobacter caeni]MBF5007132.1 helix-turn-helix domain-containing protein [Diaphorobacter caeni]
MTFNYSTIDVEAGRRQDYWAELVCKRLIPAVADFDDCGNFEGMLSGHSFGGLTVCRMESVAHTFHRTERMVRAQPNEDFVALLVQAGVATMVQGGREISAAPGDVILCDAAKPFLNGLKPEAVLLVRIPRQQLLSRFRGAENMMAVRIGQGGAMAHRLHEMAEEAYQWPGIHGPCGTAEARLASAFVDTLTAAMEIQAAAIEGTLASRYEVLFDKADRYISTHLDDGDLSSADVAAALHVSGRTLTRAFAQRGTTVMHHLSQRRLEASYAVLSERRVSQVSQAAYQCGFNNLAHFSRAFKRAFGMTPGSLLQNILH